jgi:SAM-dependent methyltransferase
MDGYLMNLCEDFCKTNEIENKKVLEVGSYDVNGSFRSIIEPLNPSEYIGIDIAPGPGVDRICDIKDICTEFGTNVFDIVVCTEVIEHVEDWRTAIINLMKITKKNGFILLTSRSKGFGVHDYPGDFWRYEIEDIEYIFKHWEILKLEKDMFNEHHFGFFLAAKKLNNKVPKLNDYALYNIKTDPRQGLEGNNIKRTLTSTEI